MFLEAWSDRLLMKADSPSEELEVFFRRRGAPDIDMVSPDVAELIAYLGHKSTTRPRLRESA